MSNRTRLSVVAILLTLLVVPALAADSPRQRLLLDQGWRFKLGHATDATKDFGYGSGHAYAKAGSGPAGASLEFVDYDWRQLDLPHDWAVELPFEQNADGAHGSKPVGRNYPATTVGWYRKKFNIPNADLGKRLSVEFDGVFRDCIVFFNGHIIGRNESGYTSFAYDVTDLATYGGENILAVRVDASQFEGWFYEGAGIYRHVWLTKTDPLHIARYGTQVISEVGESSARLTIRTRIVNESDKPATFKLVTDILDADEKSAATVETNDITLKAFEEREFEQTTTVNSPKLWSIESPNLYRAATKIVKADALSDAYSTTFGIRTIKFDVDKGFFLNGKHVVLKGTCNHQDHAGVGSAIPDRLNYWRIEKLKEMGSNAIRTSHNPPTPELLDACDKLGMLVMDEHRMMGTTDELMSQLERLVLRDRNHPSIVIWCIGNEEGIQGNDVGARVAANMQRLVHKLDGTRLCTQAMNNSWGRGLSNVIDVQGFNYKRSAGGIDAYRQAHPKQLLIGTEEASTLCTRGEYANNADKSFCPAYDVRFPGWGATAEDSWTFYAARPWLSGLFIWTGFDYRGEPNPYRWPAVSSQFGIMDTCGFPKDNFYYYQAWWGDKPVLHLFPHWNWAGKDGQEIDVRAFSNFEEVELLLNGTSLGKQKMPANSHVKWNVKYAPGSIVAKGYKNGAVAAEKKIETTSAPVGIRLIPDRTTINADGEDLAVITVAVVDGEGRIVPVADNEIRFDLTGPGEIIGVGNGHPASHEADRYFESIISEQLVDWRMRTVENSTDRPEVAEAFDDSSWQRINLAGGRRGGGGGRGGQQQPGTVVYRGQVELAAVTDSPAVLFLGPITQKGQVYINGKLAGRADAFERSGYQFKDVQGLLKPGKNTIAVIAEGTTAPGSLRQGGGIRITPPPPQWKRKVFNGLAQIIVQAGTEAKPITLTARGEGLVDTKLEIQTKAAAGRFDWPR